jgi:hypothetical protein
MCNYDSPVSYPMSAEERQQAAEVQRKQNELERERQQARQQQGVGMLGTYARNESHWRGNDVERIAYEVHQRINHLVRNFNETPDVVCSLLQSLRDQLDTWESGYISSLQRRDHVTRPVMKPGPGDF